MTDESDDKNADEAQEEPPPTMNDLIRQAVPSRQAFRFTPTNPEAEETEDNE